MELLAPAGTMEALIAAVQNGADAVYLGARQLNARAGAGNFSRDELIDAVNYCHDRGAKVHVTVNIMVKDSSEVAFVDYQGARRGSMFYDIASLLWDPYVSLPLDLVKDFFEYWRFQYKGAKIYTKEDAWESFVHASLQRLMQAMGAFCFLSKVKGIQKFEQYIEPGKKQLRVLFAEFRKIAKATDPQVFSFMERALL